MCEKVLLKLKVTWLQGLNQKGSIWYVQSELGCRIQHSDTPTVRTVPFYYVPTQATYTVLWPLKDLTVGGRSKLHHPIAIVLYIHMTKLSLTKQKLVC